MPGLEGLSGSHIGQGLGFAEKVKDCTIMSILDFGIYIYIYIASSGLHIIRYFSHRQRLHLLEAGL